MLNFPNNGKIFDPENVWLHFYTITMDVTQRGGSWHDWEVIRFWWALKIIVFSMRTVFFHWPFRISFDLNIHSLILILHTLYTIQYWWTFAFILFQMFIFSRKRSILSLHSHSNSLPVNVILINNLLYSHQFICNTNFVPSSNTLYWISFKCKRKR